MSQFFAVTVRRGPAFDQSKQSREQDGFEPHSAHWRQLEAEGFVAMAGLMQDSMEVLFIIRAESKDEVREKIGGDVWQDTGHAQIARLEPIDIRFNPPAPAAG
ncbi:MAG: hypothetical protein J7496_17090 [Novosphingobium sp.]|nr:hypothetical protein [Novosphingobium sp.]